MKISIEKSYFWVGSTLGIIISLLTIFDHFNQAAPPNLDMYFTYNESNKLNIIPNIESDSSKWTDSIPIDITITNEGDLTAKNVELCFVLPNDLKLSSKNYGIATMKIIEDNQLKTLNMIRSKDINPNSKIMISDEIYLNINAVLRNSSTLIKNSATKAMFVKPVIIKLDCTLSCNNVKDKIKEMYISIGDSTYFNRIGTSYYLFHNDEIIINTNKYLNY